MPSLLDEWIDRTALKNRVVYHSLLNWIMAARREFQVLSEAIAPDHCSG
jgi:hypothetical protein